MAGSPLFGSVVTASLANAVPSGAVVLANPTVTLLPSSPSTLFNVGGTVTLSANVTNATICVFTSKTAVSGLPAAVPCTNGAVSENVTLHANTGTKSMKYKFGLSVFGAKMVKTKPVKVTVLPTQPITLGGVWKLQVHPVVLGGCFVQTFAAGETFTIDQGGSGTYTGGGPYITEAIGGNNFVADWSTATNEYEGVYYFAGLGTSLQRSAKERCRAANSSLRWPAAAVMGLRG